jgi:hypothetical protein
MKPQNRSKTKFIKFMQQYFRKRKFYICTNQRNTHEIQRILLKLSGEALMGDLQYGIDPKDLPNMLTK